MEEIKEIINTIVPKIRFKAIFFEDKKIIREPITCFNVYEIKPRNVVGLNSFIESRIEYEPVIFNGVSLTEASGASNYLGVERNAEKYKKDVSYWENIAKNKINKTEKLYSSVWIKDVGMMYSIRKEDVTTPIPLTPII